jgi:hypothetical protein
MISAVVPVVVGSLLDPCSGIAPGVEAQHIDLIGKLKMFLPYLTNLLGAKMLLLARADFKSAHKLWTGPARQTDGLFKIQVFEHLLN